MVSDVNEVCSIGCFCLFPTEHHGCRGYCLYHVNVWFFFEFSQGLHLVLWLNVSPPKNTKVLFLKIEDVGFSYM